MEIDALETTRALRDGRPAHARFCVHSVNGDSHEIESSALPIEGSDGFEGAMVFFWPVSERMKLKVSGRARVGSRARAADEPLRRQHVVRRGLPVRRDDA